MSASTAGFDLPARLEDVDAAYMTQVLRASGALGPANRVLSQTEQGVGMTAGYFSSIKKVRCTYAEPTDAPTDFVVKAWPSLEIASKDRIAEMFIRDIHGYRIPAERFYPRPKTHLAAFDEAAGRYALVMEDVGVFATQKVHEHELAFDEVMRMIPALVDVALAWEGCDEGHKAAELAAMDVHHWCSVANLGSFKTLMPGGAPLMDRLSDCDGSPLFASGTWQARLGVADLNTRMTKRLDAFFAPARPENGATCTLSHGDMRGDNFFFCEDRPDHPAGWLCIDFQQMFAGPVPSDLGYLLNSGTVLPEVYAWESQQKILRAFYERFMAGTRVYPDYSWDQFLSEYRMMATIQWLYYVAYGAAIAQTGAFHNDLGMRIELGGKGATLTDLPPEQIRQRMWWGKAFANFTETFDAIDLVGWLAALPENHEGLGPWVELPDHLK